MTNRQVGEKLADDVVSEMKDLKSDLVHIRELLGVLGPQGKVRRNQGGDCGQKTGQDGGRTTRSR